MKYSVEGDGSKISIKVEQLGGKQRQLMEELKECAEGRCDCPTPQYAKVESMGVQPGADQVDITLKAKPGEKIDKGDINNCLEHTTKKISSTY